ncbi:hypothetical protein NC981_10840 [Leptolyngbya sp. DQ-M1]|uniref:hypothetical protein n=1 Tax=Leptolyngbya sp. DQ-M1 TaxID=2933920 RepID=UPI0032977ADC
MTTTIAYPHTDDLTSANYLVVGLATCFIKDDDGVHEVRVVEPIPSAALEAIVKGIPTSYESATATTIGAVISEDSLHLPENFPTDVQFCDDFAFRATASARTYKAKSSAQSHIPAGTSRNDFNFSVDRKRVLNSQRIVKTEDNVKQHQYTHEVL